MGDVVRKRRWGRRIVIALVVLVVPLVVGYFVATSEPFFKGVILPRVGKSLNAKITVTDASIKPFSHVVLRGVKVETTGSEPLALVQEARVRHSLMDIVRGNIKVQEIAAISPVIHIVKNPDGTSNLDPLLKSEKGRKPRKPSERKKEPASPPKIDIGQIKIENGTLRKTEIAAADGRRMTTEVSSFNLTISNLKNGGGGSVDVAGRLAGELEGALQSKVQFALTENLKPEKLTGNATVKIDKTSGRLPAMNVDLDYDAGLDRANDAMVLQKFQLAGTQNGKPFITASLARPMSIALGKTSAGLPDSTLNAKITGFSFKDWRGLLGDDVPEGNLHADLEIQSRESGKLLALKGNAELSGLMLDDPEKRKLMKPLEAKLRIDSTFREQVVELAQLAVALTPTQLAKNEAILKGRIDLSNAKAITGKLELASEALDLNGYYDLLQGDEKKKTAAKPASAKTTAPSAEKTPAKKDLPFKDLVIDTRVDHVYLRELHLSNMVAGTKLDSSRIELKPITLALNGAPVNGAVALDLGVPGYGYDLALKMDRVPLEPIANSFAKEYKGRAKGDLNGDMQIKGAGTTGVSLKKALQGQITASCTNGQIQLVGKKMRKLLDGVAAVLQLPELRTAPLTAFHSEIALGEGKIQVKTLDLVSEAFTAHTEGGIPIADVLTNSPIRKLPVTFALSRSLAERANLLSANSPSDSKYVPLPPFLYLTGTVGDPDTERNNAVIAGIIARSQILPRIGGDAGKVLDSLLGGPKATNAPTTNAPSTNQPLNPLDLFKKKKPK
jgi:uncharacterized protein involved in outer membrane biogenesis